MVDDDDFKSKEREGGEGIYNIWCYKVLLYKVDFFSQEIESYC